MASNAGDAALRPKSISQSQGGFCHGLKKARKGPFTIGVAGGTASGKSTVCHKIIDEIKKDSATGGKNIICVSLDYFYRDLGPVESERARKGQFNFDHPDAFDLEQMNRTLRDIRERKAVQLPKYDYKQNARMDDESYSIKPADVVLVEGILAFYWPELRDQFDMKLFVDTDADTRLARRVRRDISERGRTLDTTLNQYINTVKPAFEEFCQPTKKFADIIIPRGAENTVAIDLIVQSIKDILVNNSCISPTKPSNHGDDPPPTLTKRNSDSKTSRLH